MKKLILSIISILALLSFAPKTMAEKIAGESANVTPVESTDKSKAFAMVKKKMAITKVLKKHNSPLLSATNAFISTCVNYDLDCYLLPSITGLESSFGKFTHPGSHNPFGWGGGYIMFETWDKAIDTVGHGLRNNYINKGADTVEKIAPIYAASKTWAPRVQYFIAQFHKEEQKIDLILGQNEVNL